jgi:hypothetical protein
LIAIMMTLTKSVDLMCYSANNDEQTPFVVSDDNLQWVGLSIY